MRITYFLFVVSLLQVHANVFSQKKISLELENVTIEEVFATIELQSGYKFLYSSGHVNLNRKISISANAQPLDRVLSKIFKDTNIEYLILDKQIVLKLAKKKTAIAVDLPTLDTDIGELQKQITGVVTDNNDVPLAGVTVLIKGTQRGVATDFDGTFNLEVTKGEILVFSYLGFLNVEVEVTDEDVYTIKMVPTSFELEGVELVSTGYQTISKERSTGSFENVGEKILGVKLNQDILSKLQGEVPGLLFSGDNNDELIIRGLSSISAETAPLVVVDGFPVEGGFSSINPNDVQSITVLKDAAAASIWGIRATNGVVVIVTKKGGRNNKLQIDLSHSTAFTPKQDLFDNPIGSPETQIAYQRGLLEADGLENLNLFTDGFGRDGTGTIGSLAFNTFDQLNPVAETLLLLRNGSITQGEADARLQQFANTDIRQEYTDLILRPVRWNQYNLAISGGGEKHDFRTSVTYNHNENGTIAEDADQIIVNFNNSFQITSKLKARASLNFSQAKTNNAPNDANDIFTNNGLFSPQGLLISQPLNSRILDDNGNYVPQVAFNQGFSSQASQFLLDQGFPYPSTFNIKQEYDNANNVSKDTELRLQTGLDYKLFKDFEINLSYQYEWGENNRRNLYNENTYATRKRVNLLTQLDDTGLRASENVVPLGSILDLGFENFRAETFRGQFNYNPNFKDGLHQLTLLGGYEVRKTIAETSTDRKYGFNDETLISIQPDFATSFSTLDPNIASTLIPNNSRNTFVENRFISYYANGAYTFNNRYTLSASTRLDDTNLFGASEEFRNIPLYSIGAKWNIASEEFFDTGKVSTLQLRGTYGINGNVIRNTSPFLQATIERNEAPFNNITAFISSLPNPELRLEKTRTVNLGLDFGFWNQRLSGSLEYYKKNSEDLLANVTLNSTLGASGALINSGKLSNEGIDANLNIRVVETDNFRYGTTFNFSLNTNTLVRVDSPDPSVQSLVIGRSLIEGNALRTLYSFEYAGLDRNGGPQYFNENREIVDLVRTDIDNIDALINEGTIVPKYYGSWINNLTYKQLSLRVLTTFKAGHIFRYGEGFGSLSPTFNPSIIASVNVSEDFNDRWQVPGDESITRIPAIPSAAANSGLRYRNLPFTNTLIDDASHIRLSQVSLGYSFPQNLVDKLAMSNFQIGLQADNLAVWTFNRWDVDPESLFFPRQPTITLNLNVSF